MNKVSEAIKFLKGFTGVLDVFELDDDLSKIIHEQELSVKSNTGEEVFNEAYEVVMTRMKRVCIVYDDVTYHKILRSAVIELRSPDGELIGTEVIPEQMEEYKKRDDVIWVSRDFIVFVDKATGPSRFVLPPLTFYELKKEDGYIDAIWSSPSPPSSAILKEKCGLGQRPKTSTMVIGFDLD